MRIMHLSDRFAVGGGGVSNYIAEACALLTKRGHVCAICSDPVMDDQVIEYNVQHLALDVDHGREARAQSLERCVADFGPEVVMIHHVEDPELVRIAQAHGPAIAVVHGPYVTCPSSGRFFARGEAICELAMSPMCLYEMYRHRCSQVHSPITAIRLYRSTKRMLDIYRSLDCIIAVSEHLRQTLVENGVSATKVHVLYPHFAEVVETPASTRDKKLVVYAGRIEHVKGIANLISAMALVGPDLHLVLAGNGSFLASARHQTKMAQLDDRITFLGQVLPAQVQELFASALCVVVPSIWPEPFGKVGIEAFSVGTPVIATRAGGIPEWLDHEVDGLLVEPGDIVGLAHAIQWMADHPEQSEALGRRGRQIVMERYRPEDHAVALETLLTNQLTQCAGVTRSA